LFKLTRDLLYAARIAFESINVDPFTVYRINRRNVSHTVTVILLHPTVSRYSAPPSARLKAAALSPPFGPKEMQI
jgi:hypothetical protein